MNPRTIRDVVKATRRRPDQPDLHDQYRKIGIAAVASAVPYQGDRSNRRSAARAAAHGRKPEADQASKSDGGRASKAQDLD